MSHVHMSEGEEDTAFYYHLGNAITEWAHVEHSVLGVTLACIEDSPDGLNRNSVALGYWSLEGFRTRLQFSDGVVRRKLSGQPLKSDWERLRDRCNGQSRQRNKLAHWAVRHYPKSEAGRRLALVPWIQSKSDLRLEVPPQRALCVRNLVQLRGDFFALATSLTNFVAHLERTRTPPPIHIVQAGGPPTVAELRRLIHEALAGKPPPSEAQPHFMADEGEGERPQSGDNEEEEGT